MLSCYNGTACDKIMVQLVKWIYRRCHVAESQYTKPTDLNSEWKRGLRIWLGNRDTRTTICKKNAASLPVRWDMSKLTTSGAPTNGVHLNTKQNTMCGGIDHNNSFVSWYKIMLSSDMLYLRKTMLIFLRMQRLMKWIKFECSNIVQ